MSILKYDRLSAKIRIEKAKLIFTVSRAQLGRSRYIINISTSFFDLRRNDDEYAIRN